MIKPPQMLSELFVSIFTAEVVWKIFMLDILIVAHR